MLGDSLKNSMQNTSTVHLEWSKLANQLVIGS